MTLSGLMQLALYLLVLVLLVKPLGSYMARVYQGRSCGLDLAIGWFERLCYRLACIRPDQETNWKQYALGLFLFNMLGLVVVYLLQRMQHLLPLNPQSLPGISPDSSFNTAISFASNTNWQGYFGIKTKFHKYVAYAHIPVLSAIALFPGSELETLDYLMNISTLRTINVLSIFSLMTAIAFFKKHKKVLK